jgi:hypothetical protein
MTPRRVFALAVLATLLAPYARGLEVLASSPAGHCGEGICHCRHGGHGPAAPPPRARASCHGAEPAQPDCYIKARCAHEAPALLAAEPAVIAPALALSPFLDAAPLAAAAHGIPRPGFWRLESPPPRTA